MANQYRKFHKGLQSKPKASTDSNEQGDLEVLTSDGKLRYHNGTSNSPVVTEAHSAVLTNKSLDADANTITNIDNADIKAGAAIDRNKLASGTANRVAVNDGSGVLSDAAAITAARALISDANGIPTHSTVTSAELGHVSGVTSAIQTQLDAKALASDLTNHLNDATDAHDASAISNVPSGNLAATDVQGALNELQSDIDNRATSTDLSNHISDTSTHGVTGDIVGTTDAQAITNKTQITVDNLDLNGNTLSSTSGHLNLSAVSGSNISLDVAGAGQIRAEDAMHLAEQATPTTGPTVSTGYGAVYAGDDGKLYYKNDSGTVTELGTGGGGSGGGIASVAPGSTITSNYTIVSGDNGRTLNVDSSANIVNITLPAASAGFKVTIKDASGTANLFAINIVRAGSELIDGVASDDKINTAYGAVSLVCNGTNWTRVTSFSGVAPSVAPYALFGGGTTGSNSNVIDYIDISTTGNAADFGDLSAARTHTSASSNASIIVFAGGFEGATVNTIEYVTMSSPGNATDFGDLTVARNLAAGCGNTTRGLHGGGTTGTQSNVIDYISYASVSNATDFGDLTTARQTLGACASTTRGIWGGGDAGSNSSVIDYVTISSAGNATSFGNLTSAGNSLCGCSNSTRGLFAGKSTDTTSIEYITLATTGNATDFGDLTTARGGLTPAGAASSTRGVFAGGAGPSNVIDYVTIASVGNATDFGDLTVARGRVSGSSNAHGGV